VLTRPEDIIRKFATLEVYMEDVKKDIGCLQDYKRKTIEIGKDIEQIKKEQEEFWTMHKEFQKKKNIIDNVVRDCSDLGVRFEKLVTETLKDYPDMKDTYKTIKRAVILWLVISFFGVVGVTAVINVVF